MNGTPPGTVRLDAHHDGSSLHLSDPAPRHGDTVTVWLRVPHAMAPNHVVLRSVADGEPALVDAARARQDATDSWWAADLELVDPVTSYRFLVEHRGGASWVDAAGTSPHERRDACDFRISTHPAPPAWLTDAVGYEIFLDRFAHGGPTHATPDWASRAEWSDPVDEAPARAVRQWYGGDLAGIEQHLDHVADLGADLLYLTPFFPARSSHRYDATTFDRVDPLLGGDAALAGLTAAAHERGMRVVGDLTLNHTGDGHEWFERARADASSPEAGFYMFRHHPDDYVAWYDVPELPKLDHRSTELARRLVAGGDSVMARWLRPPFALDGWRVDCANTTARYRGTDHNADVARAARATLAAHGRDAWLVAEHGYDGVGDLDGDGWHGLMAYHWFTRPLVQWLAPVDHVQLMSSRPLPALAGAVATSAMRALSAGVPWTARTASMTLLDSHDTPRLRTLVGGDRAVHVVGMAALMTQPGVPTVFAGSETGAQGRGQDGARVPFDWDRTSWDTEMLDGTRRLIELRRAHPALRHGGMRWLGIGPDHLAYLRETTDERLLVVLARLGAAGGAVSLDDVGARGGEVLFGTARIASDELHLPAGPGAAIVRLDAIS